MTEWKNVEERKKDLQIEINKMRKSKEKETQRQTERRKTDLTNRILQSHFQRWICFQSGKKKLGISTEEEHHWNADL